MKTDTVRLVTIRPHDNWSDSEGSFLGAEIGEGFLHRLPEFTRSSTGSTLGFVNVDSNEIPATDHFIMAPQNENSSSLTTNAYSTPGSIQSPIPEETNVPVDQTSDEYDGQAKGESKDANDVAREASSIEGVQANECSELVDRDDVPECNDSDQEETKESEVFESDGVKNQDNSGEKDTIEAGVSNISISMPKTDQSPISTVEITLSRDELDLR